MKKYLILILLLNFALISCETDSIDLPENNFEENLSEVNTVYGNKQPSEELLGEIFIEDHLWLEITSGKNYRYQNEKVYSHEAIYETTEEWINDDLVKIYNPKIPEEFLHIEKLNFNEETGKGDFLLTTSLSKETITFTLESDVTMSGKFCWWCIVIPVVTTIIESFEETCADQSVVACGEGNVDWVQSSESWTGSKSYSFACC